MEIDLWGRELIREGLKWRVGDGKLIDVGFRNWFSEWSTCWSSGSKVSDYLIVEGA